MTIRSMVLLRCLVFTALICLCSSFNRRPVHRSSRVIRGSTMPRTLSRSFIRLKMSQSPSDQSYTDNIAAELQRIDSLPKLVNAINNVFRDFPSVCLKEGQRKRDCEDPNWPQRKEALFGVLDKTRLNALELCKYGLFDKRIPYTRNLLVKQCEDYELLMLCWNCGMESKVHSHPCDGCFVKVLKGEIKETKYAPQPDKDGNLVLTTEAIAREGDVAYMDDYVGLHKIGNPSPSVGAVTLHLYTPPYQTCKLWPCDSNRFDDHFEGQSSYYSKYGFPCCEMLGPNSSDQDGRRCEYVI